LLYSNHTPTDVSFNVGFPCYIFPFVWRLIKKKNGLVIRYFFKGFWLVLVIVLRTKYLHAKQAELFKVRHEWSLVQREQYNWKLY